MKKILLIGKDGMLGSEVFKTLSNNINYEIYATTLQSLNICDKEAVSKIISDIKPYFIINCAAYTNVDACETNFDMAKEINGTAVQYIAENAKKINATLIQISTDYVFDGTLDISQSYTEDLATNPINKYGESKLLGEINSEKAEKYYILRTAWLYGDGKNFVRTMLNLAKTKNNLNIVCDQYGSPTSTETLSKIIENIIEKKPEYGIYHSTNEGFTNWYEFAKKIFEFAKIDIALNSVKSTEYPTPAKRPKNSKLSKEKLKLFGIFPDNFEEALKKYISKELNQ
jgi:dTDP-4-dehydrorhamnose reductase